MNEYEKFCIEEAKFYMDKAHHILNEEMKDPKKYYEETFETYKHLTRVFPYILAMRYTVLPQSDSDTEESLSDTQSSVQSDEGSYDLEPQPTHLRFWSSWTRAQSHCLWWYLLSDYQSRVLGMG